MKLVSLFILWLSICQVSHGIQTQKFIADSFQDFAEGETRGVTISSDGFLRPGTEFHRWTDLIPSSVWCAVQDPKGHLFVAAGNEGQIFRVDPSGMIEEYFKAKELWIQTLAIDSHGILYAGSMPQGKVYRIESKDKSDVYFDPKEKYIWDLKFDHQGQLFIATGETGKLFRVTARNHGDLFYDSDETHLRSLLMDEKKRLWAGSDSNGLVYRFDRMDLAKGTPYVAYDSNYREIKALALGLDGSLFVAVMGNGKNSRLPSVPPQKSSTSPDNPLVTAFETAKADSAQEKTGVGEVKRILPDGRIETWWTGFDDPFSLTVIDMETIWVGMGSKGRILELKRGEEISVLGRIESDIVNQWISIRGERWIITSNPGCIWKMISLQNRKGQYESKIYDAKNIARWGRIQISAQGSTPKIFTRSGNTSKADKVWNDWTPVDREYNIQSSAARYIQFKFEWNGVTEKNTLVDRAEVFYQNENQPPQIIKIVISHPNIELNRMQKNELPPPPIYPSTLAVNSANKTGSSSGMETALPNFQGPMLQQVQHLGWRSAVWQVSDPDNDVLKHDVFYRPAGNSSWQILKKDLSHPFTSWDASTWLDGSYYLKIKSSDTPSNRSGEAKSHEMISDLFVVDNNPPEILADTKLESLKKGTLILQITDQTSLVDEAEYSIDGGDWTPLLPVNGLYDSRSNRFEIPISKLSDGEHYVIIRASDSANHVVTKTLRFKSSKP